jgi:hypothetical protein
MAGSGHVRSAEWAEPSYYDMNPKQIQFFLFNFQISAHEKNFPIYVFVFEKANTTGIITVFLVRYIPSHL